MTRDELEFSISQYLDGTLAASEGDALDERLATDAEARSLYAEYESLQGVLVAAMPMPDVDWDQFAGKVSAAVAREALPAQSFKLSLWLRPARLAIAASVLIAGGVAFSMLRPNSSSTPGGMASVAPQQQPVRIAVIDAPASGAGTTPAANNAAGPTLRVALAEPADDVRPTVLRYADSVVQRPSRAMIVSAAALAQDTSATPF